MAECKELQALGSITSEVDDSHVKIILSSQCIKAQVFLVDRLRKETERQKGVCKQISSSNLKLEAEIKHAESELKSMMIACETINSVNIEINKETLLAREAKFDTIKRISEGEKKYEDLWIQCKKRYESIPYVQKWFAASNNTQLLKDHIKILGQQLDTLKNDIGEKKKLVNDLDRKRVVDLANFMINDRPKLCQTIKANSQRLRELAEKIRDTMAKDQKQNLHVATLKESGRQENSIVLVDGDWPSLRENFNDEDRETLMMPKLHLSNNLEVFAVNLDQLKKIQTPINRNLTKEIKTETCLQTNSNYLSSFFNKSYLTSENYDETDKGPEQRNFSKKKLINILDDITINTSEANEIVSSVHPQAMQVVTNIGGKEATIDCGVSTDVETGTEETIEKHIVEPMQQETLGEFDYDNRNKDDILIPPTPFSDRSKVLSQKTRTSSSLPIIEELPEETEINDENNTEETESNAIADTQMNLSTASNESYNKMRDMIFKKHNLDLSPDFVYAKNNITKQDTKTITSKFFQNKNDAVEVTKTNSQSKNTADDKNLPKNSTKTMDIPKISSYNEPMSMAEDKPVSGFLFTHGASGIPESLDVSISTTGYEDGDGDFAHCLDSSLLLSPKANLSMPVTTENAVVYSQEVPNFLAGLRKTGFSFFESNAPETKPDSSGSQGSNFNFNFGSADDKKPRGNLFSMFN